MGDVARCSEGKPWDYYNEKLPCKLFGVNADLLIDHAWGWEACTMREIKTYRSESNSLVSGQVLQSPYGFDNRRLVVREMPDRLSLDLVDRRLMTNQIVLTVGYDVKSLAKSYRSEVTSDRCGRKIPKHAHDMENLKRYTSSTREIVAATMKLYSYKHEIKEGSLRGHQNGDKAQ